MENYNQVLKAVFQECHSGPVRGHGRSMKARQGTVAEDHTVEALGAACRVASDRAPVGSADGLVVGTERHRKRGCLKTVLIPVPQGLSTRLSVYCLAGIVVHLLETEEQLQ